MGGSVSSSTDPFEGKGLGGALGVLNDLNDVTVAIAAPQSYQNRHTIFIIIKNN